VVAETLPQTAEPTDQGRKLALLRAIGLDKASPDQRELALNIAQRYELDLLMKHLVLIDGRPYITRDGLLHVAHRSNQLDGITTSEPVVVDEFWRATASVYRKDMSHPFTYTGRYPTKGGNAKFAPEMAVKVAEVMALRRAFDVAAPTAEERWDAEVPVEPAAPAPTLAEKAAAARAAIQPAAQEAPAEPSVETGAETTGPAVAPEAAGASSAEPTANPSAPLTKAQFVGRLASSSVDRSHASALRLVLFPDANVELTDEQRGVLWARLEAEQASVTA
jgi:hypothetical protein